MKDAFPYAKASVAVVACAAIAGNIWHGFQTRKATAAATSVTDAATRQARASEALALASQRQAAALERLADEARRNRGLDWGRPVRAGEARGPVVDDRRNRVSPG
jgi:hypothetical protein